MPVNSGPPLTVPNAAASVMMSATAETRFPSFAGVVSNARLPMAKSRSMKMLRPVAP